MMMMRVPGILLLSTFMLFGNISEFEAFVHNETENKTPPSASVTILKGSLPLYTKIFGYNDANKTQKTTTKSVYHIYSLTKILTATLIMKLIEEKKIGLHDPLTKYFPMLKIAFENQEQNITVLNLLNHSSGITDGNDKIRDMIRGYKIETPASLPYAVGTEAKYSNSEYIILAQIAEQVTGEDFETLIKEYILIPTQMNRSDFHYNPTIKNNQVYGTIPFFSAIGTVMKLMLDDEYQDFYEGWTLWLKEFDIIWKPAGGLVSSIEDMTTLLQAYHQNQLFSPTTKKLFTEQPSVPVHSWLSSQDEVAFGICWYHITDKGKFFYQHQGVGPGFRTIIRIYPKYDISFAILTSQTSVNIDVWADRLMEDILTTKEFYAK
jgi:CubicO group peptidase (beta-lactamase class C family)